MLTDADAAEKRPSVFPPTLHPCTSCCTNLHFRARSAPAAAEKKNFEKKNTKMVGEKKAGAPDAAAHAGVLEEAELVQEEEEEEEEEQQQVLLYVPHTSIYEHGCMCFIYFELQQPQPQQQQLLYVPRTAIYKREYACMRVHATLSAGGGHICGRMHRRACALSY